jgi:FAD synthetase
MDTTAGIAIIGDEILSGKFADENARLLIPELRALGVRLRQIAVVSDDVDDIAETVARMASRYDVVFTSGGVGPTHDDVTMAGIAQAFDTKVVVSPVFEAMIARHYGPALGPSHRRLAEIPDGAELVYGPGLTVPVVCMKNVYILPGVPSLFRKKFLALRDRFRAAPFVVGRVVVSLDETELAERLTALAGAHPTVSFGSYPRFDDGAFHVIITAESKDPESARTAVAELAAALGDAVIRVDPPA